METGRGAWWLAVGVAVGAALLSKYTALFFGPAILIWLIAVPKLRRWLISPWPYLGGIVAFAIFSPVILWNADHQWVSFIKQFGRARIEDFTLRYIGELIPTQIAFATPLVFILGAMGLYALRRRKAGASAARVLINSIFWTITLILSGIRCTPRRGQLVRPGLSGLRDRRGRRRQSDAMGRRAQRLADFCLRWAAPSGILMFALVIVQANTGVLTGYRRDASVRSVGVGWRELAREIEAVRARAGATCVLAPDYGTTGWLAFYLPKGTCVAQRGQRFRWVNMPEPDPALLAGQAALCRRGEPADQPLLKKDFARVEKVAELKRKRGPLLIETYRSSTCWKARRAMCSTARRRRNCGNASSIRLRIAASKRQRGTFGEHLSNVPFCNKSRAITRVISREKSANLPCLTTACV